jgi:hypothetical protein
LFQLRQTLSQGRERAAECLQSDEEDNENDECEPEEEKGSGHMRLTKSDER